MRHRTQHFRIGFAGLLTAALLFVACVPVVAQNPPNSALYLESIRPSIERLESISPQTVDGTTVKPPDLDNYQLNYEGELSLRRNFARTVTENSGALLGIAFQENTVTEALLNLGQHTGMSFNSTQTQTNDVRGQVRDQKLVNVFGLKQSFGGGAMASALGFTRTTTKTTPYLGAETNSRTDALSFTGGLRRSNDLILKLSQTDSDVPGGYHEEDLQGSFTVKFSGGDGPLSFARNEKVINGVTTTVEKLDLMTPFMLQGAKAIAEYHSLCTESGATLNDTSTMHFLVPLAMLNNGTMVDYTIFGQDKGAGLSETRTAKFINPLRINGKVFGAEETYITLRAPGTSTDTLLTKLSAPLAGGQAVIQRQTVTTATAAGETEQRQLSVVLPSIKVGDNLSVQAQRTSNEVVGTSTQDVTNFNVTAQPVKPLQVEARYQIDDKGDQQALKSRQLHTKWALTEGLSLQGHLTESEVAGGSENVLRLVEVVRDRDKSGIGVRAGLASYETADQQVEGARRVEVAAGKPSGLAISAAYSEYDAANMTRYPDDALVALSVQHGDPSDFAMRWRYEDQPTRVAPLQALEVAMPALGGSLQMSYQSNPMAPDGKTVRQADQYDATLGRKLFGDVNLQVGYRYLEYSEQDLVDRNIRIQLDGGKETGIGKIALSYNTGDFCTQKPNELTPGSALDVSYARAWGSNGKLTLTLQRKTAPLNTFGEASTEGRLELSTGF